MSAFRLRQLPISAGGALAAYELPGTLSPGSGARLVVAAARLLDAPVGTVDRRILAYGQLGHVRTISY